MSDNPSSLLRFKRFLLRYGSHILFLTAILLLGLSGIRTDYVRRSRRQVARVERALHKREHLAEQFALRALNASDRDWVDFDDLPEDIVLYCYQDDTMKCWTHQFPIGNDQIGAYSDSYRLQYMSDRNFSSTPLAYIGIREKYINLGSGWYVVTTQFLKDLKMRVVTGILVKTEYPGGSVPNTVNKHLKIRDDFTTVDIGSDDTAIVYGIEGEPLFSVVPTHLPTPGHGNMPMRWIAFVLMLLAVFPRHMRRHTWRTFLTTLLTLVFVRLLAFYYVGKGYVSGEIFSPVIYADTALFNSLGNLLLNNLFVALAFYALFVMRYRIHKSVEKRSPGVRQAVIALMVVAGGALAGYIHFVMRSLIRNSGIVLEPYRLSDIGPYAIISYLSFALLFLALLFHAYMVVMLIRRDARINLFSWTHIVVYVLCVSLYSVVAMNVYGLDKEYETNRVNTSKLAIERDLSLEMFLRDMEPAVGTDPFIAALTSVNGAELIKNRLIERYLYGDVVRQYNITLSTCSPNNLIALGQGAEPIGCFAFYDNMIRDYGVALAPGSSFYYLHNFNGLASYLGVFTYYDPATFDVSRLFIELESKYKNDVVNNPFDAVTARSGLVASLPRHYSYARYSDDRLVSYGGNYNYPVNPPSGYEIGYRMVNKDGYVHFVNRLSDEDVTVISRPRRPLFPHLVSFSYLALFYGLFMIVFTLRWRKEKIFNLPKHSLKRKITLLITISMVFALGTMGVGSVIYVMRLNRENNREAMDGLMSSAQSCLSEPCKYAMRYNELVTPELYAAMEEFSRITHSDLNLYNIHGELISSTKPELFEQLLVGKRMNNKAFRQIVKERQLRCVNLESIAGVSFYSIYEPVFNGDGTIVAIVNVPYFNRSEDVTNATASTISAVINIYLILLIAAIALGAIISNSISRPIVEIKDRIGSLALSGNRRIRYRNTKDELSVLIDAYNKMVEDLEESTRRLAQNEREQAWKVMARQIAHDIKNPLTPMKLSLQYLMKMKEAGVPGWEEKLDSVSHSLLEQIETLSQAAEEFSSFASNEEITRLDLCALIEEQRILFDNRDDIVFEYRHSVEQAWVEGRRRQLARVLVNLITNAIQAIDNAGTPDGHIRISLLPSRLEGSAAWRIDVEDNGPGVGEDDLEKLFTPNFTTKKTGTGLGLAICRTIVEQNRGTIGYSRSALGGADFTIILPA